MAYTPPNGDAIAFVLTTGYTPPDGNNIALVLGEEVLSGKGYQTSYAEGIATVFVIQYDFNLSSYTVPGATALDFLYGGTGNLVSGAGHQTSRAYAPIVSGLDFDLLQYSPPIANSLIFSYVYGALAKGRQVSYAISQIAQLQPVTGAGYQINYVVEEVIVRVPGWTDYIEYIELVIDHNDIGEDLYNFPITISISASAGKNNKNIAGLLLLKLTENKLKFIIHDVNGSICYVEIEDWEYENNWAILHAKIPFVSSSRDTILRLYFDWEHSDNTGYVGGIGTTPAQAVWSEYTQVYHLNEDYSGKEVGGVKSSTGFYHLTAGRQWGEGEIFGAPTRIKDIFGYSQNFEAVEYNSGDCISGFGPSFKGLAAFTVEIWFRPKVPIDYTAYLWGVWEYFVPAIELNYGSGLRTNIRTTEHDLVLTYGGLTVADVLNHAAVTFGNGIAKGFFDGELSNTISPGGVFASDMYVGNETCIGSDGYNYFHSFNGILDEIRISVANEHSEAWVKATYLSLIDNLITYNLVLDPFQEVFGAGHQSSNGQSDFLDMLIPGWDPDLYVNILIDSSVIDEDLYDFPVRISLGNASGRTGIDISWILPWLGDSKYKILLQGVNGDQCYVEIEDWVYVDEWAELHAKLPFVASAHDSMIRLFFDPLHDDNTTYVGIIGSTPAKAVWDSDFLGVYHLNGSYDGTTGEVKDSTSNSKNLTGAYYTANSPVQTLDSDLVGYHQYFDGIADIGGAMQPLIDSYEVTNEVFVNIVEDSGYYGEQLLTGSQGFALRVRSNNYPNPPVFLASITFDTPAGSLASSAYGHWGKTYVAEKTKFGEFIRLYLDGDFKAENNTYENSLIVDCSTLAIGGESTLPQSIDEVRVSKIARSDAWIKATYHSLMDTLFTYSIPVRERHGEGYQTSYFTAEIFVNSIIGRGRQWGYSIGSVVQVQSISVSGHQTSYAVSFVSQIQIISIQGHQTSYARGIVSVKAPQKIPEYGYGYQTSYSIGSVTQIQPISASGHQTSYVYIRYFVYVTALDVYLKAEFYGVRIENNNYGVEEM